MNNNSRSKVYIKPGDNDVKPNGGNHSHPGNKKYVKMVEKRKVLFVLADTKGKEAIVLGIYNSILPGRFLQKEKGTNEYIVKDKKLCLEKIRKALSKNNATIIKNLKLRGKWPSKPRPQLTEPTIPPRRKQTPPITKNALPSRRLTRKDWLELAECFQ